MRLGRHLWGILGNGPARIAVEFHPVVRLQEFAGRKELAAHCRQAIAASHRLAISGRQPPQATPNAPESAEPEARPAPQQS
jgi:hypothetical protein